MAREIGEWAWPSLRGHRLAPALLPHSPLPGAPRLSQVPGVLGPDSARPEDGVRRGHPGGAVPAPGQEAGQEVHRRLAQPGTAPPCPVCCPVSESGGGTEGGEGLEAWGGLGGWGSARLPPLWGRGSSLPWRLEGAGSPSGCRAAPGWASLAGGEGSFCFCTGEGGPLFYTINVLQPLLPLTTGPGTGGSLLPHPNPKQAAQREVGACEVSPGPARGRKPVAGSGPLGGAHRGSSCRGAVSSQAVEPCLCGPLPTAPPSAQAGRSGAESARSQEGGHPG